MNANCINTNGSFVCSCRSGWSGDGGVCNGKYFILCVFEFLLVVNIYSIFFLDINECGNGNHDCDMNANCTNTNGSFVCVCNSGWSGDGVVCNGKYFFLFAIFILYS